MSHLSVFYKFETWYFKKVNSKGKSNRKIKKNNMITYAQYGEMDEEKRLSYTENLNNLQVNYLEDESNNDGNRLIPISIEEYRSMDEEKRKTYYKNITPEERANMAGHGSVDDPAYCDESGHCYCYPENAECADEYIAEIRELKKQNDLLARTYTKTLKEKKWNSVHRLKWKKKYDKSVEKCNDLELQIINLIDVDDIANYLDENPEEFQDVCCAYTIAEMIKENKEMKETLKKAWNPVKVCEDLVLNTQYRPDEHGEFVNYIQSLEKKLKEVVKD